MSVVVMIVVKWLHKRVCGKMIDAIVYESEKGPRIFEKGANHFCYLLKWKRHVRYFKVENGHYSFVSGERVFACGGMPWRKMRWGVQLVIDKDEHFFNQSMSHRLLTSHWETWVSESVNVARALSIPSHNPENILKRERLEYQTLERESLFVSFVSC